MVRDIMREYNFQREGDLERVTLEFIAYYQAMTTIDIWYELGEDERFKGVISRPEVEEALSRLEEQQLIKKGKDDKWRLGELHQHWTRS